MLPLCTTAPGVPPGPRGVNNYLATVLRYAHHTQEPPKDGARISQRLESFLEETRQYVAGKLATIVRRTTYMLTEEEAYGVAQPLLRQLEVDLREVVVELQARGSKPEELLASTGLHCSYTPALSPRRVGLLYGLLAFPPFPEPDPAEARANAEAAAGVWDGEWEGSVKRFSAEWYERLEIRVSGLFTGVFYRVSQHMPACLQRAWGTPLRALLPVVLSDTANRRNAWAAPQRYPPCASAASALSTTGTSRSSARPGGGHAYPPMPTLP